VGGLQGVKLEFKAGEVRGFLEDFGLFADSCGAFRKENKIHSDESDDR